MDLWDIFLSSKDLKVFKWKHYFPAYERHFARYRNRPVVMLEIGVAGGGSLQMWKRYLGPQAVIVGIDIKPACKAAEEDQIAVRIGSQADAGFLASVVAEFGPPDIVLDDGSHRMAHVRAAFDALYPAMARDGVYMVEDMMTAYDPAYGGGRGAPESFVEHAKSVVDAMNGAHWGEGEGFHARHTLSVHFYDGIVVFERGFYAGERSALKMGHRSAKDRWRLR